MVVGKIIVEVTGGEGVSEGYALVSVGKGCIICVNRLSLSLSLSLSLPLSLSLTVNIDHHGTRRRRRDLLPSSRTCPCPCRILPTPFGRVGRIVEFFGVPPHAKETSDDQHRLALVLLTGRHGGLIRRDGTPR